MKSILDPSFRYVPSASTDVRKTFARVRREMSMAGPLDEREGAAAASRVPLIARPQGAAGAR